MTAFAEPDNHVESIRTLGYSERDARFLAAVVCAGGYFVRRQYAQALGIGRGRADAEFIRRLVARRLATVHTFSDATQVLHLTSRAFYEEEPDGSTRARRSRTPLVIKARLMALDAILARPEIRFASGQAARLRLCERLRIDRASVPNRQYRPHQTTTPVTRFLPDAHLVGMAPNAGGGRALVCGFVDDGAETRDGFHTFLRHHEAMFAAAGAWAALYVCQSQRQASSAVRLFEKTFLRESEEAVELQRERLLVYVRLREAYLAKRWEDLDTERIRRLFDYKQKLGPLANLAFEMWQLGGDPAIDSALLVQQPLRRGHCEPLVLGYDYSAVEPRRGFF